MTARRNQTPNEIVTQQAWQLHTSRLRCRPQCEWDERTCNCSQQSQQSYGCDSSHPPVMQPHPGSPLAAVGSIHTWQCTLHKSLNTMYNSARCSKFSQRIASPPHHPHKTTMMGNGSSLQEPTLFHIVTQQNLYLPMADLQ